ncbi:MAG: O-antigen ligase family protein [Waterburya sp.]
MKTIGIKPQNLPEKLIWYYIIGTYFIYYLGGQYLFAPLLGYFLVLYLFWQWWNQTLATPPEERITIPFTIWLWVIGILIVEVALIVGHLDFDLGLTKIISSSVNRWLRTWVLFPVFMLIGSLKIRPQLIYRAVCILCTQSLVMVVIASILRIPNLVYTSPLQIFGGGENFYQIHVFGNTLDNGTEFRLLLFAPWAPALGLVANIYFFLAMQEQDRKWKWLGMIGAVAMVIGSVSRLAIICLPVAWFFSWLLLNISRPLIQLLTGLVAFCGGFLAPTIINVMQTAQERFSQSRASSSKVRAVLGKIAIYRWQNEAFIWGHGTVSERGPKLTGHMAIGTHHTWFSILYNHGLVGCLGLAIPLFWSLVELVFKAQKSQIGKVGLSIILVLIIFSLGDNLDVLTYIYWPGLVILGIALQEDPVLSASSKRLSTLNSY